MSNNSSIDTRHIQMLVRTEIDNWTERLDSAQASKIETGITSPDIDGLFDLLYRKLSEATGSYIRDVERRALNAKLHPQTRIAYRRLFQRKRAEVNDVLRELVSSQRKAMINDGLEADVFNQAMADFGL